MFGLRTPELIVIFLVVFVLFGAGRLPQLGKSLGGALRGFKKELSGEEESRALPGTDDKT